MKGFSRSRVTLYGGVGDYNWEDIDDDMDNPYRTELYDNLQDLCYDFVWISDLTEMMFSKRKLLSKYDLGTNSIMPLSIDGSWIIENPGQQMLTGSFQPIESSWQDWLGMANVHHYSEESWKLAADEQEARHAAIKTNGNPLPSVYWVPFIGEIPRNAIPILTREDGITVYAGRTFEKGVSWGPSNPGVLIGQITTAEGFQYNNWMDSEIHGADNCEILVGDRNAVEWYTVPSDSFDPIVHHVIDEQLLVFGGHYVGNSLYVGKGLIGSSMELGKISKLKQCRLFWKCNRI
ncbi:hypothetical protein BC833DRAFT_613670 [Globomyces pollinis-pini]|nr:hypothetical protein BC833DRAFT_613670 [Globomyces pollinis-pini]